MSWVCWEISLRACIDSLCDIQQRVGLQLLFQIQFVSALSTETFWEVGQTKQTETDIIVRTHRYTTCPCPSFRKTMLSLSCVTTHMAASPLLPPLFTCMLHTAFPLFITSPALASACFPLENADWHWYLYDCQLQTSVVSIAQTLVWNDVAVSQWNSKGK